MSLKQTKRPVWPLFLVPLIFTLIVVGAWGWFQFGESPENTGFWIETSTDLPGIKYEPEQLSESALTQLGTTNYTNGKFIDKSGTEFLVFNGNWLEEGRALSVVQHTPDICWVQAGWKPVAFDIPRQINVALHDTKSGIEIPVPFECRIFESPDGRIRQLTLWCTLIGGRPIVETPPMVFAEQLPKFLQQGQIRGPLTRTQLAIQKFGAAITKQIPSEGSKQFIRFSTKLDSNIGETLRDLEMFASDWIHIE